MKNKCFRPDFSILFFFLTMALALFSWIASIYGWGGVHSLLSAEGVRWMLGHVVENYVQAPALGVVLILSMGLGISARAGLYDVLRRVLQKEKSLSRKERRALTLALVAFCLFGMCVMVCLLLPWNFLLSITGSWLHSPFSKGFVFILSIGIGLWGIVYGFVADTFRSLSDVVSGMSWMISRLAPYFVALFFIVQFFCSLTYTGLMEYVHVPDEVVQGVYLFFSYLPLFFCWKR